MHTAKKNFAYNGETYFVGDKVPAKVAKALDASFTKKPTSTKTEITEIPEGE